MKKENKNRKDIDFECTSCADPYSQCTYIKNKSNDKKFDSKSIDNFIDNFIGFQFFLFLLSVIIIFSGYLLSMIGVNVQFLNSDLVARNAMRILLGIFVFDLIIVFVGSLIGDYCK